MYEFFDRIDKTSDALKDHFWVESSLHSTKQLLSANSFASTKFSANHSFPSRRFPENRSFALLSNLDFTVFVVIVPAMTCQTARRVLKRFEQRTSSIDVAAL